VHKAGRLLTLHFTSLGIWYSSCPKWHHLFLPSCGD